MADLHSAAGNESRCNCFGRPGTNPGCPAHGNHATRPAESPVDGPTDLASGGDTGGPGWDREWLLRLPHHLPSATYDEPDIAGRARRELDALLADRDRLGREAMREPARARRRCGPPRRSRPGDG